jgi:hypothetical protein
MPQPVSGKSIRDVLGSIDYKPSSISNRLAPSEVQIGADSTKVTFDGKTLVASKKDIAQAMSKFSDPDELAKMVGVAKRKNGDIFKVADNYVRVDVPSLAATRYFETIEEAKEFLATDMTSMKNLKDAAGRKGLSFYDDHDTGGFLLGDGTKVLQAKNKTEVLKILQGYPDTPGAREILSALDPQADTAVKAVIDGLDPKLTKAWKTSGFDRTTVRQDAAALDSDPTPTLKQGPFAGKRHSIRDFSSSMSRYIEATINRELGRNDLGKALNTHMRNAVAMDGVNAADKTLHNAIFTGENGRLIPLERRNAIVAYREAQGVPEALPGVKEKYGDLSSNEEAILGRLGKLYDKYAERFGLDPSSYVKGYMSHVKKYTLQHWSDVSTMVSAEDVLEQSFKGLDNVPKKLMAYFRNERAESLLNAVMEDDPIKILNRYTEAGNKEFYLKQSTQNILDYLKVHGKDMPTDVIEHIMHDLSAMSGTAEMAGMAGAQNLLESFHKDLTKIPGIGKLIKPTTPGTGAKMFSNFMSLTYLGQVGFRPWLSVRNIIQPYQMLAPRIGLAPVHEAMQEVLGKDGREILKRLRAEGTLMSDVPVAADIGTSKISNITKRSMREMYTSDDITRAVSAISAENMLDDGIRAWNAGKLKGDINKFQELSEIRSIKAGNPELANTITKLALSGDQMQIKQAKVLFGQKLASEIQPDFARYAQPHVFTNTLPGYVFGRFGTYSAAYRENIYRGWQAAQGFAQKSLFVGRFIGVGVALAGSLSALGINGKDFLPGYSGLFGGGPQFHEALTVLQAASPNAQGAQAMDALQKLLLPVNFSKTNGTTLNYPTILPGSLQLHYGKQMLDAIQQGDYWKAFLAFSTVPTLK